MASTRRRAWSDTRLDVTLVAAADQRFDLLADAPIADSLTVVRIVGDFWAMYDPSTTVADSLSIVDVAIGVAAADAFAANVIPDPTLTAEYPPRGWLYVNTQPVKQILDAAGGVAIVDTSAHFKFDIRSMRKIDKGVLFLSVEQNNVITGGVMRVIGRIRALALT